MPTNGISLANSSLSVEKSASESFLFVCLFVVGVVLYVASFSFYLCKHQSVNKLYSRLFCPIRLQGDTIFVKMVTPMK